MFEVIFDNVDKKNNIGESLIADVGNSNSKLYIVAPYVSDLDNIINISDLLSIRIICNADSNSCNPLTLERLVKKNNVEIKSRNDIHAKIYILDNSAYITSANPTPNGLGNGTIEAAVKIKEEGEIEQIKKWFDYLWIDCKSEDVKAFTPERWEKLKANWRINNRKKNSKNSFYELFRAESFPDNISIAFWCDGVDLPNKDDVEKVAKNAGVVELPSNVENWDYYLESENFEEFSVLKKLLDKYKNQIFVNIKVNKWPLSKAFGADNFPSRILDTPIKFKKRSKECILSLYRTDVEYPGFVFDQRIIDVINKSININCDKWADYFKTIDGRFGYCTKEMFYELTRVCF
jgi:hypothetical protein